VLYTAPTLIRSLMQHGDHFVTQHDRSSLRILGTVGEPINPHAWEWYHQVRRYSGGGGSTRHVRAVQGT
jgi:acetyl-CoA synthetase